ncbi:MAG TPA: hypothetical protein VN544_07150 [Gaiellaceae bacterium]|jgi:uncharacterized membrane protein|nr:hypothetical protein [Gaiellaceae bacterium]
MSLLWAGLVVALAVGLAVSALLLVRRRAPDGSFFADGDRAAGVFGVLATGFSVLLGLIVFLAFSSYDKSRSGAETEALLVAQQFETAQFFPVAVRQQLGNELICYARSVIHQEWPTMRSGRETGVFNPWGVAMFRTLKTTVPKTAVEQAAYGKWVDLRSDRELAREDRRHGAEGVIPATLWVVLFFIAGVICVFMLLFADSGERAIVQAVLIGSVVAVIGVTLFLIRFLNDPLKAGYGAIQPVAMERTLGLLFQERKFVGQSGALPCDGSGAPAR